MSELINPTMSNEEGDKQNEFCGLIDEATSSISSVRQLIKSIREKRENSEDLDMKDGISLLSLKHHTMLAYLRSLVLLSSHRLLGHSFTERSSPALPFSSTERDARGSGPGDLIDSMVEGRVVLEKIKVLESRMRYQIDKLVRVAEDTTSGKDVIDDPLAFRPNPKNLVNDDAHGVGRDDTNDLDDHDGDGIYHPPRLAPVPYVESTGRKEKRQPVPTALSSLLQQDPHKPHMESTSGLGSMPSLASNRAREIQRMTQFEEENFTRLVMNKKDSRRRKRDEENLALGGDGVRGRRRGAGLEDEFNDVLRSVGRPRAVGVGDGYEELRKKGKKQDALSRSKARPREEFDGDEDVGPKTKRTRFERDRTTLHRKTAKTKRRP